MSQSEGVPPPHTPDTQIHDLNMGARVSRDDYYWSYTEEPHKTRRKEMLAKYPEIKQLMGGDPSLVWKALLLVTMQLLVAWFIRSYSLTVILIVAYCYGGTINHMLTLIEHEASHNVGYGANRLLANRLLGLLANIPLTVPYFVTFKKYHVDHHKLQGFINKDVDLANRYEAALFKTTFTKLIWVIFQPIITILRPAFVEPKPLRFMDYLNLVVMITGDGIILLTMGRWSLFYLFISTVLGFSLHPMIGHLISAHYMFTQGQETASYYGPMNYLMFNIGYHTEHHDFPNIPGSRLPMVRKIASEYYDTLPHHTSLMNVIYQFITNPDISLHARVIRHELYKPDAAKSL